MSIPSVHVVMMLPGIVESPSPVTQLKMLKSRERETHFDNFYYSDASSGREGLFVPSLSPFLHFLRSAVKKPFSIPSFLLIINDSN